MRRHPPAAPPSISCCLRRTSRATTLHYSILMSQKPKQRTNSPTQLLTSEIKDIIMSSTSTNTFEVSEIRRCDASLGLYCILAQHEIWIICRPYCIMGFVFRSFFALMRHTFHSLSLPVFPHWIFSATGFIQLSTLFYHSTGVDHERKTIGTMERSHIKVS